jgi:beta-galactosidase
MNQTTDHTSNQISYDNRAITINGKRQIILSGAIHYPRSTPEQWAGLMQAGKAAGLNTIETYVFWNYHERERGVYNFANRLDLMRFCQTAKELGLHVILRIGPYICAETNFGGFPAWLREVPGLQTRTYNEPFMREMGRWVRFLCDYLRPMFASNGGPIIMAQIENEYDLIAKNYGEEGQKYLQWAIDFSQSLNLGIPWVMCVGSTAGAIETINGVYGHEFLDTHYAKRPNQPALWTENWPGWYDTYGYVHHRRSAEDVAYGVARFFAGGGTGVNYYMFHGGTNFNRETMYLGATSYDFDAPLDEYGLPTTKYNHLAALHNTLTRYADALLSNPRAMPISLGNEQSAFVYTQGETELVFLCNDSKDKSADVSYGGRDYRLPPQSVIILDGEQVVFNSAFVAPENVITRHMLPIHVPLNNMAWWGEPLPEQRPHLHSDLCVPQPVEQLSLTKDRSDYCWYSTTFTVSESEGVLTFTRAADVLHVFVDGVLAATTPTPIREERGRIDGEGFTQRFSLTVQPGTHHLSVLCCAVGLIKGDWMLGQMNMTEERKGLWGDVLWNNAPLTEPWLIQPATVGEKAHIFAPDNLTTAWQQIDQQIDQQIAPLTDPASVGQPLRWWRVTFPCPSGDAPLAVDMRGMSKGIAWLNGRCIGRYWLVDGTGETWAMKRSADQPVEPTQRYYNLPRAWLEEENTLILFEELGGDPRTLQLCHWE